MSASDMNDVLFSRRASYYYVGSFDDEILRYSEAGLTLDTINETMSQAALFGNELLVNDGSLMLSAEGRIALTDRERSPLIDLIEVGFVKIFTRNGGDLAGLPKQMKDTVPTYRSLLMDASWPLVEDRLQKLCQRTQFQDWPARNLSEGFGRLLTRGLERMNPQGFGGLTEELLEELCCDFQSRMGDSKLAGRTTWRLVCESRANRITTEAMGQLHWLGLEAYHYNLAMASVSGSGHRQPGVLTRYSHLFRDIRGDAHRSHHASDPVTTIRPQHIPTPSLPRSIIWSGVLHKGKILRAVVCPGDVREAKDAYLNAVDDCLSNTDHRRNAELLGHAQGAADKYGIELRKLIRDHEGGEDHLIKVVTIAAGVVAGAAIEHTKVHTGGMGAAALGAGTGAFAAKLLEEYAKTGAAWVAQRFRTRNGLLTTPLAVDILDPLEDFGFDTYYMDPSLQGANLFAMLGISRSDAQAHLDAMPIFTGPESKVA